MPISEISGSIESLVLTRGRSKQTTAGPHGGHSVNLVPTSDQSSAKPHRRVNLGFHSNRIRVFSRSLSVMPVFYLITLTL
jgi:hypothetical protein